MDFHSIKRKQLQSLCKKHGIPANKSNREMANLLSSSSSSSSAFQVTGEERSSIGRHVEILDKWNNNNSNNNNNNNKKKKKKKVRFSPVNETREYEPTPAVRSRRRRRNVYVVDADPAANCTPSSVTIGKSRAEEAVGRDGNGKGVSQVVVGRKRRRGGEKIGGEEKDGANEDEKNKDGEGIVRWKLRGRKVVISVNAKSARQESAGEVAEPGKGNRRSIRKAASQSSDSADVLVSESVKVGARIGRRNTRSGAQCQNDVPEVEGILDKSDLLIKQSSRRNLGRKSVAPLTVIVGSDGVEAEKVTRKQSRNHDDGVEAPVETKDETDRASALIAPLRRSKRKTVHLGSTLVTDYIGNGGAVPKMPELVSQNDVNVIDENVRLTRNASRCRSMVASETIQNDKVAAGSQKIGRRKGVPETVQEKGPLVGLGESLVGNHDGGVEASVETRGETEKASALIAPLRRSNRKTVHLGSTLATDYLGNGGAAPKMPELVSEKDVNVIDENVRLTRNASRRRSMAASETIQNDKVAAGSQKIGRRKGVLESVQEKGPLVGSGESLVGKRPRLSVRLASEAALVGSSVPSKTAGKKKLGMANLQNEIAGLDMQESRGDTHRTSTNHSKEFCRSGNNKGSKSKSSGKRRSCFANVFVDHVAPVAPSEPLLVNDLEEVMVSGIEESVLHNDNSDENGQAGLQTKTIDLVSPYVGFSSAIQIQSGKVSNMPVSEKGQKNKESSSEDCYDVDHNSAPDENNWKEICHNGTVSAAVGAKVLNVNAEGTIGGERMETNLVDAYTEEITKGAIEPAELNRIANEKVDSIDKLIPLTDSPHVHDRFCRLLENGPNNCNSAESRVADCQTKVGDVISSADVFPSANHNQSGAPSVRQWLEEGQESEQLSLGKEVRQGTDDLDDHSAGQETEVLEETKQDTVAHHSEHEKNYDYDNALAADGAENSIDSTETVLQVDVKLLSPPFRTGQICGKKEHEDEVSDIGSKKRLSICPDVFSLKSGSQDRDENPQEDQQMLIADCHPFQKAEIVLSQTESLLSCSCDPVVSVDKKKITPVSNSEVEEELCKLRQADALPHSFSEDFSEERNPSTRKSSDDSQLNFVVCISKQEVKDGVDVDAGKTTSSDASPKSSSSDMFSMKLNDSGKMVAKGDSREIGLVHAATDSVSNFTLISDDSDVLDKSEEVHKIINSLNDPSEEPMEMFSSKNEELGLTTRQLEHNFVEKTVETAPLVERRCHDGWGTQETVFCDGENDYQMVLTFEGEEGNGLSKEESKVEVADSKLQALVQKIGNQIVEEEAQECECDLPNFISVVDTAAKATHSVIIERLELLEVQNGIDPGPDTALGDGEDFPQNGYDHSGAYDADSDASTQVVADNSEELDETIGRVAESVVEFEMKADKLANFKEDTSEIHDGSAGPQVLVEHLPENKGDHIAFPSDILGSMNVEANKVGKENSGFIKDDSNFAKIAFSLLINSNSEKHDKHNSGEGTVCANVSFGKCRTDSMADVVSGLSVSHSPASGMHNGSPLFTDWEANLFQENGDHNLLKASIEDSEFETQFQDVSNDACEMETISVNRGDNLSEIGQELEQNNAVLRERNGGAEKAVEDWNDAMGSAGLKSSGVDPEEYTVEQPDQLHNSVNALSEENSSELNISFGGEEQLQVEELYTQAVQIDLFSKNDAEEGMKLSEDVLKQDGLTADESLAASCSAVDQDIAGEVEYSKDQTQSPSPDETVFEMNILTIGGEKHIQEGKPDIQALQRDLISKDEGKPDSTLVAEKLSCNPQGWMEEQAADPKYEDMEDLEKQDIFLREVHSIQTCIPCKNDNDKSGKAQNSDVSSQNMIMIKVVETNPVLDEDSMDHLVECDSSNIKQDTTARLTIADAEEKKALREDVLEQDGSTADLSLASFCSAVDQDIAGEGEYPKCQLKSPSPQKTVSRKKQGCNSLFAKRLISSAMPQKATDASQTKENAPIFKREHFVSLTAPKTLSKRRALEDLKQ